MSSSFKRHNIRKPASGDQPSLSISSASHQSSIPINPRITPSPITPLPGCKPHTNSTPITSFGLREIDSFFFSSSADASSGSGGQPLQSFVLIEEDRLADDLARCLGRYWIGEGVAQGQCVVMPALVDSVSSRLGLRSDLNGYSFADVTDDETDGSSAEELVQFKMSLPRNLHLDKFRAKAQEKQAKNSQEESVREPFAIIDEQDESDSEHAQTPDQNSQHRHNLKDEGLVNAWQYRKSVQDARSGMARIARKIDANTNVFCHSFDLSKTMWEQHTDNNNEAAGQLENPLTTHVKVVECHSFKKGSSDYRIQGMNLFRIIWTHIQSTFIKHPQTVIRLFLRRLPIGPGSVAMPLIMAKIRQENLPIVILATIRPWRWITSKTSSHPNKNKIDTLSSLRNTSDTLFSIDSFSSFQTPPPPEFSLLQGILTVRKSASFTTSHYTDTICFKNRPLAERFGIKRDGRKVTVTLLHLPPEEYSRGGSSTSGVRSGGGNVGGSGSDGGGGCSSAKLTGSSDW